MKGSNINEYTISVQKTCRNSVQKDYTYSSVFIVIFSCLLTYDRYIFCSPVQVLYA